MKKDYEATKKTHTISSPVIRYVFFFENIPNTALCPLPVIFGLRYFRAVRNFRKNPELEIPRIGEKHRAELHIHRPAFFVW